jgi:hypothetical protein
VDSRSVGKKENSMAYISAFDRRMRIGLTSVSQKCSLLQELDKN